MTIASASVWNADSTPSNETLRKDLDQRHQTLETWARKQVDALDEKVKAERTKRSDELKTLRGELKTGLENLDQSLGKLDDASSTADTDLRNQILELTKTVSAEIAALSGG